MCSIGAERGILNLVDHRKGDTMLSRIIAHVSYLVHRFNKERYFRYRNIVIGTEKKYPMFIRQICNFYVASVHKKYCASICTGIDCGARFDGLPILPHDLCGIFIASTARIGKNCTILHHVTIGGNPATFDGTAPISQAATIGDNVIIGAGAKIIGDVKIGNNVRILVCVWSKKRAA